MQYTAFIERDARGRTTIEFPTLEGCSTFAEQHEDVHSVAQEALESWLEARLIEGESPTRPTHVLSPPVGAQLLQVSVSPQLAERLRIHWSHPNHR